MAYSYANEKSKLFTDEGQRSFLKTRDKVRQLLSESGAFMMEKAVSTTWERMAEIDRLVELGEIVEVKLPGTGKTAGQHRTFVASDYYVIP